MFILRQTSVKMAVLLHKQAKVPFIIIIAVKALNSVSLFFHHLSRHGVNNDDLGLKL